MRFGKSVKRSFGTASKQSELLSAERSFQFEELAQKFKIIPEEQEIMAITDLEILKNAMTGNKKEVRDLLQKKSVSIYKVLQMKCSLQQLRNFQS